MVEKYGSNQVLIDGEQFSYLLATVMVGNDADKWQLFEILANATKNNEPNAKIALTRLTYKL